MRRPPRALHRPAITAAHFPFTLPGRTSAPFVLSAYVGKTERHFSVVTSWRGTPDRSARHAPCRQRTEFGDFQDRLDEYIALYGPAAVLASSAPVGKALMARLIHRHPHLVKAVEADLGSEEAQLRAFFDVVIERRISFPAEAAWRDLCVRQFCAVAKGKVCAAVRGAIQVVAHAHQFTMPTAQPRRCAVPGATERLTIAAGMIGFRAVTVDRQPGERPGLCSTGREAIARRLAGPVFHIKTEISR